MKKVKEVTENTEIAVIEQEEITAMQNFVHETGLLSVKEDILTTAKQLEVFNILKIAAKLSELKNMQKGVSISSTYLEMTTEGTSINGIFIRYKWIAPKYQGVYQTMTDIPEHERENFIQKDKQLYKKVECVEFVSEGGEVFMCGGVQFVNSFKERFIESGQEFNVTYKGKKDRTKIFDIKILYKSEVEYIEID